MMLDRTVSAACGVGEMHVNTSRNSGLRARIAAHRYCAAQSSQHIMCLNGTEMSTFGLQPDPLLSLTQTLTHLYLDICEDLH